MKRIFKSIVLLVGILRGCFSVKKTLYLNPDLCSHDFYVSYKGRTLHRGTLTECETYLAKKFYRYGVEFTVNDIPGDYYIEGLFRVGKLNPKDYVLGGV